MLVPIRLESVAELLFITNFFMGDEAWLYILVAEYFPFLSKYNEHLILPYLSLLLKLPLYVVLLSYTKIYVHMCLLRGINSPSKSRAIFSKSVCVAISIPWLKCLWLIEQDFIGTSNQVQVQPNKANYFSY